MRSAMMVILQMEMDVVLLEKLRQIGNEQEVLVHEHSYEETESLMGQRYEMIIIQITMMVEVTLVL